MSAIILLFDDVCMAEHFDDEALEVLRATSPKDERIMIEKSETLPVYEGKETQVTKCFFNPSIKMMAVFSYMNGNDDPRFNGWAVRFFTNVVMDSPQETKVMEYLEARFKGSFVFERE